MSMAHRHTGIGFDLGGMQRVTITIGDDLVAEIEHLWKRAATPTGLKRSAISHAAGWKNSARKQRGMCRDAELRL